MTTLTIKDKLNVLDEKLDNVILLIEHMQGDARAIKHDLYGNGKKGLVTRVEELENSRRDEAVVQTQVQHLDDELDQAKDEIKNMNKKVAYFSGAAAVIMFLVNKVVELLK